MPEPGDELKEESSQPEQPAEVPAAQPPTTPNTTPAVEKGEKSESDAQPSPDQTAAELLAPHKATLDDPSKKPSPKIKVVFDALYKVDSTVLNKGDLYYAIRKQLRDKFSISSTAIDKVRDQVLTLADKDHSDEPELPEPIAPTGGSAPAGDGGGAPFGTPPAGDGEPAPPDVPDEPMVWDKKKVGRIVALPINLGTIMSDAWVSVSKAERAEIGDSFLQIFKDYLPTTKKTGSFLAALAALEMMLMPRITGMIEARKNPADIEKIKEKVKAKIKEAVDDEE